MRVPFSRAKTDLKARPNYHHNRESNEAHLTIVMAALAVSLNHPETFL